MRKLPVLVMPFLFVLSLWPAQAGQNAPRRATSVLDLFNQEAKASDPAGIHKYSEDLIQLIVPPESDKGLADSLGWRLAAAEEKARAGKGKLVPEANVVRAFNELMQAIGAPQSWRADETSVRRFRARSASIPALSALFSADRNGTICNPGEAVFLLYLLIYNNGGISEHILDEFAPPAQKGKGGMGHSVFSASVVTMNQDATEALAQYALKHNRRKTVELFNTLAKELEF